MPVGTGPTMLLALSRPKVQAHFAQHHVQLPLQKSDTPFFDPAVMGDGIGEPHQDEPRRLPGPPPRWPRDRHPERPRCHSRGLPVPDQP